MDASPGRIDYPFDTPPAPGAAIEVADGILWMRLPLPMALDHVNVYALDDGAGWTLVDTGFASRKTRGIWQSLLDGPLGGRPVSRVLVTHHHPDHIGLAGWFQSEHRAELVTTRTAWLFARMLQLDEQDRPTPETVAFWRRAGMAPDILAKRLDERPFNFADMVAPMPLGFTRIREGDTVTAGGRHWTVRIGHGHAPEHATLWSADGDLVIGGDQLLPSISPNLGVYATEPEADPVADWIESCTRLSAFASDGQLVLPGHKMPFTGLPHRMWQLEENHHGALSRLRGFLDTPRTAAECFQPLFLRRIGVAEYGLALVEAMAHCLHLWHQGEVDRTESEEGAWLWQRRTSPKTT
ncbi:MBL fold metallo-hydrolase [Ovoidimarina sediminis]|uniref:MBL fold metallo-hydrolase n=1 Tax=Ovoidimarina sediminis TaxID=3079856 RepID=UPI00290761E6|nr:MBL fold metallo-hydrolase [Rhodophyticola sp. MJ-SS7]MDU8943511.1 MBL fold metallo-hydrolase [Rhodophyticola sp. MJ-SS7]